jgi:hypothetical protein
VGPHARIRRAALISALCIACSPVHAGRPAAPELRSAELPSAARPADPGEPVPSRWRVLGRIVQVDRSERIVLILADPVPLGVPAECFARDPELRPTARIVLGQARRSGVFAGSFREGEPKAGEEVVFEAGP